MIKEMFSMSENFYVDISAADEITGLRFGVFMGVVATPDTYVCKKTISCFPVFLCNKRYNHI